MSVAVCDSPAGRFEYLGDVKTKDGRVYGISPGDYVQFDPGVFIDDDNSVYLYSGFCPKKQKMNMDVSCRVLLYAVLCQI